jgi:ATP-dependent helicase HrpB
VSDSDLADRVRALEAFADRGGRGSSPLGAPASGAARFVLRAAEQLERTAERAFGATPPRSDERAALLRAVLHAWPDRVARRRTPGDATDRRAVMVGGRGVRLADESAVTEDELFVCCALDAGRRGERAEGLVRIASGIERAWLAPERITTRDEVVYDRTRERVVAVRRTRYEDLVLDEASTGTIDDALAAQALVDAAGDDLARIVPLADPELTGFLARVRSLAGWMPELQLPTFDDTWLRAELATLIHGARTFDEARKRSWPVLLFGRLDHRQRSAL